MKDREIFSRLITTAPFIIRLDGRSFHTFSTGFEKPFDERFSQLFIKTAKAMMSDSGFSPDFIYTFSDEINMYVRKPVFDYRVEKLVSVSAAYASSAFTLASRVQAPLAFDSRIIPLSEEQFPDYLSWRQAEAWRNHINGYCQKILTDSGLSASSVQKQLDGMNVEKLHELAYKHGINLAKTPAWQRRGIAVYHGTAEKPGFNLMTGEHVLVLRNTVIVDSDIPLFKTPEGRQWLNERLALYSPANI